MVADRLKDPDLGVDAMLALLERDLPSDDLPVSVPYIGDETRDQIVAAGQGPPALPALYVTEDGPFAVDGEVRTEDHRDTIPGNGVAVAIRYLEANSNTIQAVQARSYVLRAVVKVLKRLLDNAGFEDTLRNGISLESCEQISWGQWSEKVGEARVGGALVCLFRARDSNP